jgi:hypothetical protein
MEAPSIREIMRRLNAKVMDINVVAAPACAEITIVMRQDGKERARVQLGEDAAQRLIRSIAERRTVLFPAKTEKSGDERLQVAHDPQWEIDSVTPDGTVVVNLRHPGMGWLQFRLPQGKAAKLSGDLIRPAGSFSEPSRAKSPRSEWRVARVSSGASAAVPSSTPAENPRSQAPARTRRAAPSMTPRAPLRRL